MKRNHLHSQPMSASDFRNLKGGAKDRNLPTATELSEGLARNIEALCRALLPGGNRVGNEWVCGDVQGNLGQSLKVHLAGDKAGVWCDFNGDISGDSLGLVKANKGLSTAEAMTWAADWLNMSRDKGEHVNGTNGAVRTAPIKAPREAVPEGVKKARAIEAKLAPSAETPAARYLAGRRIDATALGPDIGFLPKAWRYRGRDEGALVVLARDATGEVIAVQLIYLVGDRKASREQAHGGVQKRTVGPISQSLGWVVPGTAEQAECLIFTEGPEDALTAAQATGLEARATLGLSNLAKIVIAMVEAGETRQIVIAADPPGNADADKQLRGQIAKLNAASIEVLVAQHSKNDLNALLQAEGEDAVRALIDGADGHNVPQDSDTQMDEARPPDFSDEYLALQFSARHADRLRYVSAWGQWRIYDGYRWRRDETMRAFDLARAECRQASAECTSSEGFARSLSSAKSAAAVERLAKADRRHAATVAMWDADPWLLNTPDGVVDLRTGKRMPHSPLLYMTKMTAVGPAGECPLWQKFLDEITNGNQELQSFLQRMAGYALTGITREHAMFFFHGTGANGKSVLLAIIAGLMGDYHTTASMDMFTAGRNDRHPTELAQLRGARLVTASETNERGHWNESRIKTLTGGDRISARFMRQDFFEYVPQFKLMIAGNHKPQLRCVDEAIRRRLHFVPFDVTIPPDRRDLRLADKLKAEWSGILAWAIAGAVEWAKGGLLPPAVVQNATDEYLQDEDVVAQWLSECVVTGSDLHFAPAADLFQSWRNFAERAGEPVNSCKWLSQTLQARGFKRNRRYGKRGFSGIKLK